MGFPTKTLTMKGKLPPDQLMKMLAEHLSRGQDGKPCKYVGTISGNEFTMRNRSKLPALVSGRVSGSEGVSTAEIKVSQDIRLTLGELCLLVVLVVGIASLFPDLPFAGLGLQIILLLGLYISGFYSEVVQAEEFLHQAWKEPD